MLGDKTKLEMADRRAKYGFCDKGQGKLSAQLPHHILKMNKYQFIARCHMHIIAGVNACHNIYFGKFYSYLS